jgi:singapore isolate B (sub-type 7) whole genome shotgun sequence assembly, scaffold_6
VAVKVTSLSELLNIRQELALQKTCHHSNIMTVGDCFNWKDKLWIVMEYMEKGSLFGIVGKDVHFEEKYIAYVCKGILSALSSMHHDNRIHRGNVDRSV